MSPWRWPHVQLASDNDKKCQHHKYDCMTLQDIDKVDKSVRHSGKPNQQCELFGSFWQYKHVIRYHEVGGCHLYMLYTQTTKVTNPQECPYCPYGSGISTGQTGFPPNRCSSWAILSAMLWIITLPLLAGPTINFNLLCTNTSLQKWLVLSHKVLCIFFCNGEPGTYYPTYNFWL